MLFFAHSQIFPQYVDFTILHHYFYKMKKGETATSLHDLQFEDLFNLDEIQSLQDQISEATGVASIITTPEGTPISKPSNFCRLCSEIIQKTEKGRLACCRSESILGTENPGNPVVKPCLNVGLLTSGARIAVGGKHIANWLIGQVRSEESDETGWIQYADELGVARDEFIRAYQEVPVMSHDRFQKLSEMLVSIARELAEKAHNNLHLNIQVAERAKASFSRPVREPGTGMYPPGRLTGRRNYIICTDWIQQKNQHRLKPGTGSFIRMTLQMR
jgi:ligand-binding sensor protein